MTVTTSCMGSLILFHSNVNENPNLSCIELISFMLSAFCKDFCLIVGLMADVLYFVSLMRVTSTERYFSSDLLSLNSCIETDIDRAALLLYKATSGYFSCIF